MNKNILYCSTFNSILYQASGQALLKSFAIHMPENELLVCYEDNLEDELKKQPIKNLYTYNVDNDEYRLKWIEDNKQYIHTKYGGTYEGCNCRNLPSSQHYYKGHIKGCWGLGFTLRFKCWHEKIVALKYALQNYSNYDVIFWLDCDCIFQKNIPNKMVYDISEGYEMCYMLGYHRKNLRTGLERGGTGIEAGVCIYRTPFNFLKKFIWSFESGDFRRYDRKDDGWVQRMVLEENPNEYKTLDMVGPHNLQVGARVIQHTPFGKYIQHLKGRHSAELKIFTEPL